MNISYFPSDAFEVSEGIIRLKAYPDDLQAFTSGNETTLKKGVGVVAPSTSEGVTITDETNTPQIQVTGKLAYYPNNFRNVQYGCLRFTAKKHDTGNDFAYQTLDGFTGLGEGTYNLVIVSSTNGNQDVPHTITFTVHSYTESVSAIQDIIEDAIEEQVVPRTFECDVVPGTTKLRIKTRYANLGATARLRIDQTLTTPAFLSAFTTKGEPSYYSAPTNNTAVFSLKGATDNKDEITILHKTDGGIYVKMTDMTGVYTLEKKVCDWVWTNEEFTEFELDFDASTAIFLANGEVKSVFETVGVGSSASDVDNIERSASPSTYLNLVGAYGSPAVQGDAYDYTQIAVFNKKQHCGAYTPTSIESYDGSAYVDFNYGQVSAYDDKKLTINTTGPFHYYMKDGSLTLVSSTSSSDFKTNVEAYDEDPNTTLSFNADDLTFHIVFDTRNCVITNFTFDAGTPVYDENDPYNFEDLFEWVRRQLGYPQVACELTDEQLYDNLTEATYYYNKYRNWNTSLSVQSLHDTETTTGLRKAHDENGTYYVLPVNISEHDIIDIFWQPRFSAGMILGGGDFFNQIISQTFFGTQQGLVAGAADYSIWRGSCNDLSNLIGSHISWRIYNHHLYITPNYVEALEQFKCGIKYRSSLTVEEIRNSWQIKKLTLALSMIQLGTIRSTFESGLPIGDMTVNLNGSSLIERGNTLRTEIIDELKKEQRPLTWEFT